MLFAILLFVTASDYLAARHGFLLQRERSFPLETNDYQTEQSIMSCMPAFLWMQGAANSKAECILETLSDHGRVPLGIQEQILHQTSFFQLDRWFFLARQVRSIEEFINRM